MDYLISSYGWHSLSWLAYYLESCKELRGLWPETVELYAYNQPYQIY
jgi:hypothetical protein